MFTGRIGSNLGSFDTRIELVGLKKFGPNSNLIDGRVGLIWVGFGQIVVELGENGRFYYNIIGLVD